MTALHSLLTNWGKSGRQIVVYCDESKPLLQQASFFDAFNENSTGPDLSYTDLSSKPGFINMQMLEDLAERTRRHKDLFHNLPFRLIEMSMLHSLWASQMQNE